MVAVKCHLFTAPHPDGTAPTTRQDQLASHLPTDCGRSLRPSPMSRGPFYSLTEVFESAATSQMEFPNPLDIRLRQVTHPLPSSQGAQSQIHQSNPIPPHPEKHSASWNSIKKRPASQNGPIHEIHHFQEGRKVAIAAHNSSKILCTDLTRATRLHQTYDRGHHWGYSKHFDSGVAAGYGAGPTCQKVDISCIFLRTTLIYNELFWNEH